MRTTSHFFLLCLLALVFTYISLWAALGEAALDGNLGKWLKVAVIFLCCLCYPVWVSIYTYVSIFINTYTYIYNLHTYIHTHNIYTHAYSYPYIYNTHTYTYQHCNSGVERSCCHRTWCDIFSMVYKEFVLCNNSRLEARKHDHHVCWCWPQRRSLPVDFLSRCCLQLCFKVPGFTSPCKIMYVLQSGSSDCWELHRPVCLSQEQCMGMWTDATGAALLIPHATLHSIRNFKSGYILTYSHK